MASASKKVRKYKSVPKIPENQKYVGVVMLTVQNHSRWLIPVVGTGKELDRLRNSVYRLCEKTANVYELVVGGDFPRSPEEALEHVKQVVAQHGIPNDQYLNPLARRIMDLFDGKTGVVVVNTPEALQANREREDQIKKLAENLKEMVLVVKGKAPGKEFGA